MTYKAVLVDADIVAYRSAAKAEAEGRPGWFAKGVANDITVSILYDTIFPEEPVFGENVFLYLTGKNNFRHEIATIKEYKGNRKGEKPRCLQEVRDHLVDRYEAVVVDGEEADDAIAKKGDRVKLRLHHRLC